MAKKTSGTSLRAEARCDNRDARLDFLFDARANGVDGQAVAAADDPRFGAGAVSHREPLWAVRHYDARPIRNPISGLGPWANPARLPLSSQTTGPRQTAGGLTPR